MADTKQTERGEVGKVHMDQVEPNETGGLQKRNRKFGGRFITPTNKNLVFGEFVDTFLNVEAKKEEFKDVEAKDMVQYARIYANHHVRKEQKHLEAYLKGKKTFTYKKMKYPVVYLNEEIYASDNPEIKEIVSNLETESENG